MLATLWTLTALSTVTTVSALWTLTAVTALSALWTLTAFTTFTCGTLHIALGLLNQHTVTQLVLAGLRVNLQQFYLNLVTLFDTCLLDGLQALPVNL